MTEREERKKNTIRSIRNVCNYKSKKKISAIKGNMIIISLRFRS